MNRGAQIAGILLYGAVSVIWLALCLRDAVATGQVEGPRVLVTVVWCFGFVVLLRRYLRQR